jgi:hypothetical protein
MDYEDIVIEFSFLIDRLDNITDMMIESTKECIDLGNVNVELMNVIDKLDKIIDSMEESNEKNMLESAKYNITYATLDIMDNVNIFDKIHSLKDAKRILIEIKAKL